MKTFSVIGCGRLGRSVCRLLHTSESFDLKQVLNRSANSSKEAVKFIGAGSVAKEIDELLPADIFLIGTPDDAIVDCCEMLCKAGIIRPGNIVFHCSGLKSSLDLARTKEFGAFSASIHPIKSFADPASSVRSFSGTFCGVEGDSEAVSEISAAFTRCGATVFHIGREEKAIYHAGTVFSSNYLVALMEVAASCFDDAGLSRTLAFEVMKKIMTGTIENVNRFGTVQALTGPISRGDVGTVEAHVSVLDSRSIQHQNVYRSLGEIALALSTLQGNAPADALVRIAQLLGGKEKE